MDASSFFFCLRVTILGFKSFHPKSLTFFHAHQGLLVLASLSFIFEKKPLFLLLLEISSFYSSCKAQHMSPLSPTLSSGHYNLINLFHNYNISIYIYIDYELRDIQMKKRDYKCSPSTDAYNLSFFFRV